MTLINKLNLSEIEFDDIRQGDVVGYTMEGIVSLGEASHIETGEGYRVWKTSSDFYLCSEHDGPVYGLAKAVVSESAPRIRRGEFPVDGSLVLTEDVGDWEEGITFGSNVVGWNVYDPAREVFGEVTDTHLLRELFDAGKLVVTERF